MISSRLICAFLCSLLASYLFAPSLQAGQEVPGVPQKNPVAIVGATLHTVSNGTVRNGTIVFQNGRITAVGNNVVVPPDATVIEANGNHVYPGLISATGTLGLNEIEAVRATRDASEVGPFNPNVRAEVAYDPDSDIIPTVRSNGILLCNVQPQGGMVSGMSSIMRLDGWTREDIAVVPRSGMVVNWPTMTVVKAWWMNKSEDEQREDIKKTLDQLYTFFREAQAYCKALDAGLDTLQRDLRFESMRAVFAGKLPLIVQAHHRLQIEAALDLAHKYELRLIIQGGTDALAVADRLRSANVPIILRPVNSLPVRDEEPYDVAYTLPARLKQAGVQFCIADHGFWQLRSLPFQAGTAVAYGLSAEDALEAVTLSPARILGIDKDYGSLDVGKSATVFVSEGDALDVRGNVVTHAWIDGRAVDLENRHTRLARKYRERYSR